MKTLPLIRHNNVWFVPFSVKEGSQSIAMKINFESRLFSSRILKTHQTEPYETMTMRVWGHICISALTHYWCIDELAPGTTARFEGWAGGADDVDLITYPPRTIVGEWFPHSQAWLCTRPRYVHVYVIRWYEGTRTTYHRIMHHDSRVDTAPRGSKLSNISFRTKSMSRKISMILESSLDGSRNGLTQTVVYRWQSRNFTKARSHHASRVTVE